MKFLHFSDIHYGNLCFFLPELLGKRALGMANYYFNRRKKYNQSVLSAIFNTEEFKGLDAAVFTGDITSTALHSEFSDSRFFFRKIKDFVPKLLMIPGNHDNYEKRAFRENRYFRYMDEFGPGTPEGFPCLFSTADADFILFNSSAPAGWTRADGFVGERAFKKARRILEQRENERPLVILNHFPAEYPGDSRFGEKRRMRDLSEMRAFVEDSGCVLYLHGHEHRPWIIDKGGVRYADAGSATMMSCPSCLLHEIKASGELRSEVFIYDIDSNRWIAEKPDRFIYRS
ncbi:MAG: metallophosphoesterase family protein [Fibrobacterota bacterium]